MKIGIIGAGHIGGALTRRFRATGHQVTIANSRGPDSLAALADEIGATAGEVRDAVSGVEVVVVTIPLSKIPDLPRDLFADAPTDLIVVDTSNYYPQQRDGRLDGIEDGNTESGWVERHLGRPSPKHSTRSLPNICKTMASPLARRTASPWRSRVTTPRGRRP